MRSLALAFALLGCGGEAPVTQPDAAVDGHAQVVDGAYTTFLMNSPVLAAGAPVWIDNTCDGNDISPALAWSGGPPNTVSFAVTLTDKSISQLHWVIYDIPAANTGIPANIDHSYTPVSVVGAHQTMSYVPTKRGYRGPCPPLGEAAHSYEFAVYALDIATLPNTTSSTTLQQAAAKIVQHRLELATLTGTYVRTGTGPGN